MQEQKPRKTSRRFVRFICCLLLLGVVAFLGINAYVKCAAESYLLTEEQAAELEDMDCILVLGCQVFASGRPSDMLADRLDQGISLYWLGAAPRLLMSGDHAEDNYNEVGVMKRYAKNAGVPSSHIFMDHAGFSTYESMYRAKEVFQVKRLIIVTQGYHLYRAVYVARQLGLEAYGVPCDAHIYSEQERLNQRELFARCKDFFAAIFQPLPTVLDDPISIQGDGDVTND